MASTPTLRKCLPQATWCSGTGLVRLPFSCRSGVFRLQLRLPLCRPTQCMLSELRLPNPPGWTAVVPNAVPLIYATRGYCFVQRSRPWRTLNGRRPAVQIAAGIPRSRARSVVPVSARLPTWPQRADRRKMNPRPAALTDCLRCRQTRGCDGATGDKPVVTGRPTQLPANSKR